jgi:nitrite reductase/ring-hydroxylating ferredoxin subunit
MADATEITRRTALIGAGAGGGVLLLAACSGGGSSGDDPTVQTPATSASATPTTSSAAVPTSTPAPPTTVAPVGTTIVALSAVPVGGAVSAKDKNGKPILVAQPSAGQAVAFSAVCPHQQCMVAPASDHLECPCHHSRFQTLTGALINGPATTGLSSVAVSVSGGNVVQA